MSTRLVFPETPYYDDQYRQNNWHRFNVLSKLDEALLNLEAYRNLRAEKRLILVTGIELGRFNKAIFDIKARRKLPCWENREFEHLYNIYVENIIYASHESEYSRGFFEVLFGLDNLVTIEKFVRNAGHTDIFHQYFEGLIKSVNRQRASVLVQKGTTAYPCKFCKTFTCVIEVLYDRAFDEGATNLIRCTVCDNAYRV
jgi:DNA-directed RNA polymerase subunit M/transcription elongation factor TFIIS